MSTGSAARTTRAAWDRKAPCKRKGACTATVSPNHVGQEGNVAKLESNYPLGRIEFRFQLQAQQDVPEAGMTFSFRLEGVNLHLATLSCELLGRKLAPDLAPCLVR